MRSHSLIVVSIVLLNIQLCSGYSNIESYSDVIGLRDSMGIALNSGDDDALLEIRDKLTAIDIGDAKRWIVDYYLGQVNWYLAIYYQQKNNKDAVKKCINEGIADVNRSIGLNEGFADSYILLAAFGLFELYLNPTSSLAVSQQLDGHLVRATELDPENPRISLIYGIYNYYTPEIYGGGFLKARDWFLESIDFFETYEPDSLHFPNWGKEEPYVWLGQIAERQDSLDLAKSYYQRVLDLNPNYSRVKDDLLPNLAGGYRLSGLGFWLTTCVLFGGLIAAILIILRRKISS